MVTVFWTTLLGHNLACFEPYVDEFIIVVKHLKETIIDTFWKSYRNIPIRYVVQGEEKGTGAAIKGIDVKGDIIVMYTDHILSPQDVAREMHSPHFSVLVQEVDNPKKYGIFQTDDNGFATDLVEKPQDFIWNLANFGYYKVNSELIDMMEGIPPSPRWEIEITDGIKIFLEKYPLQCVQLEYPIIDITSLEDYEKYKDIPNLPPHYETT